MIGGRQMADGDKWKSWKVLKRGNEPFLFGLCEIFVAFQFPMSKALVGLATRKISAHFTF